MAFRAEAHALRMAPGTGPLVSTGKFTPGRSGESTRTGRRGSRTKLLSVRSIVVERYPERSARSTHSAPSPVVTRPVPVPVLTRYEPPPVSDEPVTISSPRKLPSARQRYSPDLPAVATILGLRPVQRCSMETSLPGGVPPSITTFPRRNSVSALACGAIRMPATIAASAVTTFLIGRRSSRRNQPSHQ